MPISSPTDLCTSEHRWQHVRLMALTAPLHLAFVHHLDAPNCKQRGAIWVGMATSKAWETAEEGASGASSTPPTAGVEASDLIPSDS